MGGSTSVKVDDSRHQKMKELALKNNRKIVDEYNEAIDNHVANKYQEMVLKDSKLEEIIINSINKSTNRLAAMQNSNNLDTSIVLLAVTHIASKILGIERNEVYNVFRKEAVEYESNKRKR